MTAQIIGPHELAERDARQVGGPPPAHDIEQRCAQARRARAPLEDCAKDRARGAPVMLVRDCAGPEVAVGRLDELAGGEPVPAELDRLLLTVLFTDIVASTEQLAAIGDRAWRAMLDRHDDIADRLLGRYRGRLVHVTGDGLVAVFDAPARAIGCACAIRDSLFNLLGLEIRAGLHTGEVEQRRADITGLAVHIAQRVQALAPAGAVFVSRTVVDLVAGSGISFTEIGERTLKGVPNPCHIYSVRQ